MIFQNKDSLCWDQCKDLGLAKPSRFKLPPENFNVNFNSQFELELKWSAVNEAQLYIIQFRKLGESNWNQENDIVSFNLFQICFQFSISNFISNFSIPKMSYCSILELRIAAIDFNSGISPFSEVFQLEKAHPKIDAKLKLRSLIFDVDNFY